MSKLTLNTPITELSGVGKTRAAQFNKLGVNTVGDLIYCALRSLTSLVLILLAI